MEFQKFLDKIDESLEKREAIIFTCSCEISYSGRAEAFLGLGDRIIIIKKDRNILIHQPENTPPINYMKSETSFTLLKEKDHLRMECKSKDNKEFLDIEIFKIHSFISEQLEDKNKITLQGCEKDMANMIMGEPTLIDKDFKPLNMEEHTKFGFIDVFGYDEKNNLVIVECKRYTGDLKAVSQLRRYVEKMKSLKGIDNIRGILACPRITPNAEEMLKQWNFEYRPVEPPKYMERYNKNQTSISDWES